MKQYMVEYTNQKNAQSVMNEYGRNGWRVVAVTVVQTLTNSIMITFEKDEPEVV